jgi:hypothetical protein
MSLPQAQRALQPVAFVRLGHIRRDRVKYAWCGLVLSCSPILRGMWNRRLELWELQRVLCWDLVHALRCLLLVSFVFFSRVNNSIFPLFVFAFFRGNDTL